MFIVTIVFSDNKRTREFYLFRNSFHELQEALQKAKVRLEAFGYKVIAHIVESLDEHFSKDNSCMELGITYH